MFTTGIQPISIGKEIVTDYRVFAPDFLGLLADRLSSFFNPDEPITQCEPGKEDSVCRFCDFKVLCNR